MLRKNFTYGDFWVNEPILFQTEKKSRELVEPESITTNASFITHVKKHNYRIYLDYNYNGYAHTDPKNKEIVLNGNYSEQMITSFFQHEMGHVMLFNMARFISVRADNLSSLLSKEIYKPTLIEKYGLTDLLHIDNIIQDIIIETVSGNDCICETGLREIHSRLSVKHLTTLEAVKPLMKEALQNLLTPLKEKVKKHAPYQIIIESLLHNYIKTGVINPEDKVELPIDITERYDTGVIPIVKSFIKDIIEDNNEIIKEFDKTEEDNSYYSKELYRNYNKKYKLMNRILRIEHRLNNNIKVSPRVLSRYHEMKKEYDVLNSSEYEKTLKNQAEETKVKALNRLKRKLENSEAILQAMQLELARIEIVKELLPKQDNDNSSSDEGETDNTEISERNSNPESDNKDFNTFESGAQTLEEYEEFLKETAGHEERKDEVIEKVNTHSFDCGLPLPIEISRDESFIEQTRPVLKNFWQDSNIKSLTLFEEDLAEITGGLIKSTERESTYFRSSKREWDETDMLKGRKRLYKTGFGVLIGLDISGSMSKEWTEKFEELSVLIKSIETEFEIDNIHYFTYHHNLAQNSSNIDDLKLIPSGGNAFGYVYQQMMKQLPMLHKNEIILVTDCGDNLGFELNKVCKAERNGQLIENHITIVDTEYSAFYNKGDLHEKDWDIYRSDDSDLITNIKNSISNFIS